MSSETMRIRSKLKKFSEEPCVGAVEEDDPVAESVAITTEEERLGSIEGRREEFGEMARWGVEETERKKGNRNKIGSESSS